VLPIGFMFLQCRHGSEKDIIDSVKSISGVVYAYKLESLYDVVVKIESNSVEQFTTSISAIRRVPNILNTDTMVGFK